MVHPPKATGLFLCDQVIFDRDTQKPSLIGCFTGMPAMEFPFGPKNFELFSSLTDGLGEVTTEVTATNLETEVEIYNRRVQVVFSDPLMVVLFRFRVLDCKFPQPGVYLFALSVADVEIAACRVRVYERVDL
jgi:hypothetical protein